MLQAPGYVANTAQRLLAEEVTRFVHGEEGLQQALKTTQALAPGAGGWAGGWAFRLETLLFCHWGFLTCWPASCNGRAQLPHLSATLL